ncbi:hypothetical protein pEaSNUABM25_00087 [Erwinia phage pEa_SNUABM_25]|nr:hypothetical protein pEaSNUABM25_00087 [Erwinia phage pEa_SNUABM_25]
MISNRGLSLAQLNSVFPATAIAANTLHIGLFKGTKPQMKNLMALSLTSGWNVLGITGLGLSQANFLGSIAIDNLTPSVNPSSRTISLPLAGSSRTLVGVADGTPTYFVARIVAAAGAAAVASWANFMLTSSPGTLLAGPVLIGTVGAEGSDAELQFIGGTIKTSQAYRFLDLSFQV